MTPKVAILCPLYKRVHQLERLAANLADTTPTATLYLRVVPKVTPPFTPATNMKIVPSQTTRYGEGINLLARQAVKDGNEMLFIGADDLEFHPGWYEAALAKMVGPIKAVGTNDMGNPRVIAGQHATHFLVAADYLETGTLDKPGDLLHEGYGHQCVDDEFRGTAILRGVWAHAHDSKVEHLHPVWQKGEMDATYERGMESMDGDIAQLRERARQYRFLDLMSMKF